MRYLRILSFFGLLAGCGATVQNTASDPAENRYEQSIRELDLGMFSEAIAGFSEVKTKYPYSPFAALADLRLGDAYFDQAKYIESIDAYRNFLRFHPNHKDSDFALLRIAECYFEKMPSDWWLLPPSEEKDQDATKQALRAYREMLNAYPNSKYAEKAKEKVRVCRTKLASHELYVAHFYFKKNAYRATKMRLDYLLTNFSGLGLDQEALWMLARIQNSEENPQGLSRTLEKIIAIDPKSKFADKAKALQKSL